MTTKRFTFKIKTQGNKAYTQWYDNKNPINSAETLCGLLNELHEENQSSKEFIEQLQEELVLFKKAGANMGIDLNAQITALKQENEHLKEDNKILNRINDKVNGWNGLAHDKIFKLEKENEQLKKDLIDHSALISMLEDYQALKIGDTLWNLTDAKSEEEFNELYKPYLEKAKRCWR